LVIFTGGVAGFQKGGDQLTVELVQSIREAEVKADELIRRARQEARQAVKDAEAKAAAATGEQLAAAEKQAGELIRQAELEAQAEAEPLRETSREEIAGLRTRADSRMSQAVAMIKERITSWP
jgi:V/A-type H+-transporting ATPase subunit G/H